MNHIELRQVFIEALKRIGQSPQMGTLLYEVFKIGLDRDLITSEDLRGADIDDIKRNPHRGVPSAFGNVYWPEISALFWSFVTKGLISIGRSADQCELPFFQITRFGREVLDSEKAVILDPTGMTASLKKICPDLDPIVEEYLAEAAACYDVSCNKAALVMLGCAAEKTLINVIDAFASHMLSGDARSKFENAIKTRFISKKYEEFTKRYSNVSNDVDEHFERDDIKIQIDSIFNLIRYYRNKSGHPTEIAIDREEVISALLIFPHYYKICEDLIQYFKVEKPSEMRNTT